MVVTLQVDMVDMVRETMRRFFLHSSLHKFMLTKRFVSHASTTISFGWVLAVPGRSPSRNSPPIGTSNLGEPMRNCRFERFAGCWSRSTCPTYVPHVPHMSHMSHICPTYVPHMSHICPTYVPHMSHICPTYVPHVLVVVLQHTEAAARRRFPVAEPPRFSPILQPKLHPVLLTSGLHLLNWNQKVEFG